MEIIAFDSHKRYTLCSVENEKGEIIEEKRIEHERGNIQSHLSRFTKGSPVAVETIGNWYWIIDEIEKAGMEPRLVHARKAKMMMACVNKTDRLDVRGLNKLQRAGTLPTVWIPPMELRDKRDLCRTRVSLVAQRTTLKNRIHWALSRYGIAEPDVADLFGNKGRDLLEHEMCHFPENTRFATRAQLNQLDSLKVEIEWLEERIREVFEDTEEMRLLRTIPGIGFIFAVVIAGEVGDVGRFASSLHLASYSGTTPRVKSSGGKTSYGRLRSDSNQYLKWAFLEAANVVCINRKKWADRHVSLVYERIRPRKGHGKAIGAVARHLAESVYRVLKKKENYRDPATGRSFSTEA
ncbi:MAG: IS110 family transposase [Acidobacteria bacterium]|nr:IS110 family transposase [Acidobacteriota bacterium]